jgi:hypothetical protein
VKRRECRRWEPAEDAPGPPEVNPRPAVLLEAPDTSGRITAVPQADHCSEALTSNSYALFALWAAALQCTTHASTTRTADR